MRAKKTLFDRLYEAGEEGFNRFAQETLSHPAVVEALKTVLKNATTVKGRIDKSVETSLSLFNLPSKDDYNKLLTKVETLQGSLVNLSIKLDRLLAAQETKRKPARRKPGTSSPRAGSGTERA